VSDYEQLTLDLEFPVYDHYTIELRKGDVGNMTVLRSHNVADVDDAINLIDGMSENGTVYMIIVVPPLSQSLLVP
jgi:hypothetical protein